MQERNFALMSDMELVKGLMAVPADGKLHKYFFQKKCRHFLKYISKMLYGNISGDELVGELYEFLSDNDWKVLKMWNGKNGCSLNSYLASCSLHYFTNKAKEEKKRSSIEVLPSTPEIIEYLDHFTPDEEVQMPPVWDAYSMLKERDQVILRLLVIEEMDMMDAAPIIMPYMKTMCSVEELSQKHIQSMIAMAKHRALIALAKKMGSMTKN